MNQVAPLEIGIPVQDLERMLNFYQNVFGCKELQRADIPAELSQKIRVTENGYVNVWLQLPGGEIVKLVSPPKPPTTTPLPEYFANHTGIAYFTLYCDDISSALTNAEQHGATLHSDRSLTEQDGVKLAFLGDPEGNIFERARGSIPRHAHHHRLKRDSHSGISTYNRQSYTFTVLGMSDESLS